MWLDGNVFAATGVAGSPARVARGQSGVETEAGHQHRQQGQSAHQKIILHILKCKYNNFTRHTTGKGMASIIG